MEISKIIDGVTALQKINQHTVKVSVALDILRNIEECNKVVDLFESRRSEIIKPLGDNPEKASKDLQEAAVNQLNNLLTEDVEIHIKPIPLSSLENIELSAAEVSTIRWIINEDA